MPDHPVVNALRSLDLSALAESERARRKDLSLPPFATLAEVDGPGADEFTSALSQHPGVMAVANADGFLVRAESATTLADACAATSMPPNSKIRLAVDPPRV
jgi:primosomal protein N'